VLRAPRLAEPRRSGRDLRHYTSSRIDRIEIRLDRIERRLGLIDA
jgi:hypothetical protein